METDYKSLFKASSIVEHTKTVRTTAPSRMRYTGRVHRDKTGKALCPIFTMVEKETRYTPAILVKIRTEQTRAALKANAA